MKIAANYFDYNATTPISPAVADALRAAIDCFGNPSSPYGQANASRALVALSRAAVADLVGARPDQMFFTSSGTEANNWALFGFLARQTAPCHIVTSAIEHPAVLAPLHELARARGVTVTLVAPRPDGAVAPEDVRTALRPDTRLISMMLANNETGVLQPVEEIGRIAAGNEAFYHVDAVQAAGKVAVDVARIGCDALSLSGHKFHAPKGVGCLFLRDWEAVGPFIFGGGQEAGLRSGTENLLGIAGIGVAAREALAGLTDWSDQMTALTDRLRAGLDDLVGGIVANGGGGRVPILPNTLNVSVAGVRGEALAALLDARHGIAVSIGSACGNNRAVRASHVLRAMGLSDQRIAEAIRISIGRYTTGTEIDGFVGAMAECVGRLRRVAGTSRHAA